MYYTRASAPIKLSPVAAREIRFADPTQVFVARCQAIARLVASGDYELIDSVDALQASAVRYGLVQKLGQDRIQSIMADALRTFCPMPPPPTSEVCRAVRQTSPASKSDEADPDDDYAGLTHSFARACRAAAHAQRTRLAAKPRFRVAESTLEAAEFLQRLGDRERLRAWLAEHSHAERIAIRQHLKRAKAKCPK